MSFERALTPLVDYFLEKILALLLCHALPSILVNVNLLERVYDESDDKENNCFGIARNDLPFGQYLGGGELD